MKNLTLNYVCEKQKEMDEKIKGSRERKNSDIILSMIAEIIEWNEECEDSHKTWKKKEHNKEKELEEFVDILFFIAQLRNYEVDNGFYYPRYFYVPQNTKSPLFLISNIHENSLSLYSVWNTIAENRGYSKRKLAKVYEEKYQKNLVRIKGEWQDGKN